MRSENAMQTVEEMIMDRRLFLIVLFTEPEQVCKSKERGRGHEYRSAKPTVCAPSIGEALKLAYLIACTMRKLCRIFRPMYDIWFVVPKTNAYGPCPHRCGF
jgi:hypothetical protein